MDYDELVAKVIELLQREKRVPYRSLKRRFDLDDEYIDDLKIDIIEAKQLVIDENDRILVWIDKAATTLQSSTTRRAGGLRLPPRGGCYIKTSPKGDNQKNPSKANRCGRSMKKTERLETDIE